MSGRSPHERLRYPRFQPGEAVVMTDYAKEHVGIGRARSAYGEVLRQDGRMGLVVLRDGLRTPTHYFSAFWRHLRPNEEWPERNYRRPR